MTLTSRRTRKTVTCLGVMTLLWRANCPPARAADVEIANGQLRVSLALPSGLLTAKDLRNDTVWRQHVPIQSARGRKWGKVETHAIPPNSLVHLAAAVVEGQSIKAKATWKGHPFEIEFRLVTDEAAIVVTIDTPDLDATLPWKPNWAGVTLMTYPYAFHSDAAGPDAVVPIDEGVIYSTRDTDPLVDYKRWNGWWLHQRLSMPWWGITDGERGVMTHVATPFDCMFSVQWVKTPKGARTLPQITWIGSKRAFAYQRRVTFRFFDKGGYVAMAKAFRRGEQARGAFRSWAEKVHANPAVGRLKGALDLWHQRDLTPKLIAELRRAGVRRAIVSKPRGGEAPATQGIERDAIGAARDAGYLIGGYHNYSWIQGRLIAKEPSQEAGGIMPPGGEFQYKKTPWDPKGYLMRCPATLGEALSRIGQDATKASLNYFFLDTTTTGGSVLECYHPKHPLRRTEGATQLNQALGELLGLGLVVGSERGKWWAAASTHVFEGIETISEYGGGYYGSGGAAHWAGPYLKSKPGFRERCLGYDFNPARRLPLFQLVYHDSVYCTRRWNQDPGRDDGLWNRHDLMNILYGTAPMIFMHPKAGNVIAGQGWAKARDRYLQTYRNVCGWHEKIGFDEMTDHRVLSPDRLVQETRFSSGWTVVVNFGVTAWRDDMGVVVQPEGYEVLRIKD